MMSRQHEILGIWFFPTQGIIIHMRGERGVDTYPVQGYSPLVYFFLESKAITKGYMLTV